MMHQSHRRVQRWVVPAAAAALACQWVLGAAAPALGDASGTAGFGLSNQRSSTQTPITSVNVAQLKLAWSIPTGAGVTHAPLINGDRLYFADWNGTVYAADVHTGKLLWQNQVEKSNTQWVWYGFDGTGTLANGLLIEASGEGLAFGIDPQTGTVKWQTRFTDQPTSGNAGMLLAYNGLVYIGLQSVDENLLTPPHARGGVVALDPQTGAKVWERLLVDPPQNGAGVWSSFAVDPTTNTLYFDTGNNYAGEPSALADSLVAADAGTGNILWSRQATANDLWTSAQPWGPDYDFGAGPQLFDATINSQVRHLVGAGQKSGAYLVYDRLSGEPVWVTVVGPGGPFYGIRGEASIGADRLFVWCNDNNGGPAHVAALDLATGKVLWAVPKAQPSIGAGGGFLANDVYLVGSFEGTVKAYRSADGQVLWTAKAPGSVGSSLVVQGDTLFMGTGAPAKVGGKGASGVSAYTINPSGTPDVAAVNPAAP
jgi:polyvinyl alcohol dehydrogenase (cytochrome)